MKTLVKTLRLVAVMVAIILSIAAYWPGKSISIENQWPLYEALRTTAAVIFGVIGIWLAIIFPRALEDLFKDTKSTGSQHSQKMRALIRPMAYSTAILTCVLIAGLLRPVCHTNAYLAQFASVLRGLSFSVLTYLTLLQIWTLLIMLLPGEALKDEVEGIERRNSITDSYFSRGQREE